MTLNHDQSKVSLNHGWSLVASHGLSWTHNIVDLIEAMIGLEYSFVAISGSDLLLTDHDLGSSNGTTERFDLIPLSMHNGYDNAEVMPWGQKCWLYCKIIIELFVKCLFRIARHIFENFVYLDLFFKCVIFLKFLFEFI